MTSPSRSGPYSLDDGACAYGHPVNGFGRCEPLNSAPDDAVPPGCPTRLEREAFLAVQPVDDVVAGAAALGVPIPPLTGEPLRDALVPLILAAEGYR